MKTIVSSEMASINNLPNVDLYEMCRRGDEGAWHYVYTLVLRFACGYARSLWEKPEDLAQIVVCKLLEDALDKVKKPESFRSYIFTIAKRKIQDSFKKHRESLPGDDMPPARDTVGEEAGIMWWDLCQLLNKAVQSLGGNCPEIIDHYIHFKLGLFASYKELAKSFGVSVGAMSSRVNKCLDELARHEEVGLRLKAYGLKRAELTP